MWMGGWRDTGPPCSVGLRLESNRHVNAYCQGMVVSVFASMPGFNIDFPTTLIFVPNYFFDVSGPFLKIGIHVGNRKKHMRILEWNEGSAKGIVFFEENVRFRWRNI